MRRGNRTTEWICAHYCLYYYVLLKFVDASDGGKLVERMGGKLPQNWKDWRLIIGIYWICLEITANFCVGFKKKLYFLVAQLECMWNFALFLILITINKTNKKPSYFLFILHFHAGDWRFSLHVSKEFDHLFWCSKNGRNFSLGVQNEWNKWKCAPFFWRENATQNQEKNGKHAGNSQFDQEIYNHVKMQRKIVLLYPPCLNKKMRGVLGRGCNVRTLIWNGTEQFFECFTGGGILQLEVSGELGELETLMGTVANKNKSNPFSSIKKDFLQPMGVFGEFLACWAAAWNSKKKQPG